MDKDMQVIRRIGGEVDDIVITGDTVHLERMDKDAWWVGIYRGDRCVSLWIACKDGAIDVEVQNDGLGCVDDSQDAVISDAPDEPPAGPEVVQAE